MAGSFGFEEDKYDVSIACGERVLLPEVRGADAATIIVADGFSCREQISQTTHRQAKHTAEVLRMAIHGGREAVWPRAHSGRGAARKAAVAAGIAAG